MGDEDDYPFRNIARLSEMTKPGADALKRIQEIGKPAAEALERIQKMGNLPALRRLDDLGRFFDQRRFFQCPNGGAKRSVTKPSRGRGRPKGSGSLRAEDAPLVKEMRAMVDSGVATASQAASKLAHRAAGHGISKSKAKRLERRFRRERK